MKFINLSPILWTENIQETIDFYTKYLGFICSEKNNEWGWASLFRDEIIIMFSVPNEHSQFEKSAFTGSLYINTDNVEEIWGLLKDKVKIVYPIENFEWEMREFAIYDNNGYIIQFGQEILSEQIK
jgi:uncharacterized glyoxalase superfamily protein PhnB